jgi:hypothetical protein
LAEQGWRDLQALECLDTGLLNAQVPVLSCMHACQVGRLLGAADCHCPAEDCNLLLESVPDLAIGCCNAADVAIAQLQRQHFKGWGWQITQLTG